MRISQTCRLLCAALSIGVAAMSGCAASASFTRAECRRIENADGLQAVTFHSLLNLRGLEGQQLIYRVALLGPDNQPIRSIDGVFQDKSGYVGAAKTLMVFKPGAHERDIAVTIPADELEIKPDGLPAAARFGLFSVDNTLLADALCRLPVGERDLASPGTYASAPPPRGPEAGPPESSEPPPSEEDESGRGEPREPESDVLARYPSRGEESTAAPPGVSEPSARDDGRVRHTVKRGDTLRSLAQAYLGDGSAWRRIRAANPGLPNWLRPGQTIWIPAADDGEATGEDTVARSREDRGEVSNPRPISNSRPERKPEPVANADRDPVRPQSFADRIARQEQRAQSRPNDFDTLLDLRLMYLLNGEEDKALRPIPGYPGSLEKGLVSRARVAIEARVMRGEDPEARTSAPDSLHRLIGLVQEWGGLVCPKAILCTKITGFGRYTRFSPAEYRVGQKNSVLLYVEIDNFTSERTDSGSYRTLLAVQEMLFDESGTEIWRTKRTKVEDLWPQRRKEFYLNVGPYGLPTGLDAGAYALKIEVSDLLAGEKVVSVVKFRVVP